MQKAKYMLEIELALLELPADRYSLYLCEDHQREFREKDMQIRRGSPGITMKIVNSSRLLSSD